LDECGSAGSNGHGWSARGRWRLGNKHMQSLRDRLQQHVQYGQDDEEPDTPPDAPEEVAD
jgi:hypothetical protein